MLKALLLAAGRGTRLRPLTDTIPKCLVPVGDRSLLDYWVEALLAAGVKEAIINTHHFPEKVRQAIARINASTPLHLVESNESELRGSAGSVKNTVEHLDLADATNVLLIYADNLSNVSLSELLRFHRSHEQGATMMLFRAPDPTACGIVELDSSGTVQAFVEKPSAPKCNLANAGVLVFDAKVLREVAKMKAFDLSRDVLPRFVGRIKGFIHTGYHRDLGSLAAWRRAQADVAEGRFTHPPASIRTSVRTG